MRDKPSVRVLVVVVMLLKAENGLVHVRDDADAPHPHHANAQGWRSSGRRPTSSRPGLLPDYHHHCQQQSSRSVARSEVGATAQPRLVLCTCVVIIVM